MLGCVSSDKWKEEVAKVIPNGIAVEAMLRVARSVATDSKFANCEPTSFLSALLKCARAGLYPDGREAHLIAFGRDVQAIFDVKGICALASREGITVTPKLVHANDEFEVDEDDGAGKTRVLHKVDYRKSRGEIAAVYSRATLPNGQVDYEFMTTEEVEQVRNHYSRAKESTPWKNSWGEMAKKTVIKRHSKRWDLSPETRSALNSDDDSAPPLAGEVKPPAAPLFKGPAPVVEAPPPAPPAAPPKEARPKPARPTNDPVASVRQMCKVSDIKEETLIGFLKLIGMAEESDTTLEEVNNGNSETMGLVMAQWDEFSARMKEGQ